MIFCHVRDSNEPILFDNVSPAPTIFYLHGSYRSCACMFKRTLLEQLESSVHSTFYQLSFYIAPIEINIVLSFLSFSLSKSLVLFAVRNKELQAVCGQCEADPVIVSQLHAFTNRFNTCSNEVSKELRGAFDVAKKTENLLVSR